MISYYAFALSIVSIILTLFLIFNKIKQNKIEPTQEPKKENASKILHLPINYENPTFNNLSKDEIDIARDKYKKTIAKLRREQRRNNEE